MTKVNSDKKISAGKAVEKVKKAPHKLIEHTVDTALRTVEKAAEKQALRTEKAVQKQAKKAIKRIEKNTAKTLKQVKKTAKVNPEHKIRGLKEKIAIVLHPDREETFYYDRRQIMALVLFNALLAFVMWGIVNCLPICCLARNWFELVMLFIIMFVVLASLASSVFVMIFPQKLAVVNNKMIKIDHNEALKWKDVEFAEERLSSCLSRRPIIALHLKKGVEYPLTFMQKLCQHNVFTAFSIPLYAMREKDAERIRQLVMKNVKYKNSVK